MKKFSAILLIGLLSFVSCTKGPGETKTVEGLSLTAALTGDLDVSWKAGDAVGVIGVAAATDPSSDGNAVRMEASSDGKSVTLKDTGCRFIPDETIPVHKFVGFSPYAESVKDPSAIAVKVPSSQVQDEAGSLSHILNYVPFCGKASVESPLGGTVVKIQMAPAAAVLKIPVVTGENSANKVTLTAAEGAPALTADTATLDSGSGVITAAAPQTTVEVKVTKAMAPSTETRYVYAAVLPGDFTGYTLTADILTDAGHRTVVFDGAKFEAGKIHELKEAVLGPDAFKVDMTAIAFDKSFVYDVKDADGKVIAAVCNEYLGATVNQQAVVVYGLTSEGKINAEAGLVARVLKSAAAGQYMTYGDVTAEELVHGGLYSFSAGYSKSGTSKALQNVYVAENPDGSTSVSAEAPEHVTDATVEPSVLVLSDRKDTYPYKLVKVGKTIWTAEDLRTTLLPDGTDISTTDASVYSEDSKVTAEGGPKPRCIIYNNIVYYNGYCAGAFPVEVGDYKDKSTMPGVIAPEGWKVPTGSKNGDWGVFAAFVKTSSQLTTDGNNVTNFGATFHGRVAQNGTQTDGTAGIIYWSSSMNYDASKNPSIRAYFIKITEGGVATAPSAGSGTTIYLGFGIRLVKMGAIQINS
ncbi:MAG: hypothetical protein MJY62_02725 [Bacteroidales bacterium]|nr:hypothetical protein [Bacteroidales bacterium]